MCTAVYDDMTLAAPFSGRLDVRELGRGRFLEAGEAAEVPRAAVEGVLDRFVSVVATAVEERLGDSIFDSFPNRPKVMRMLALLAEPLL
ncbi:MAG: hypothetical protein GY722_03200 [bacterium]|nr:hypothetical protein [bacterium]